MNSWVIHRIYLQISMNDLYWFDLFTMHLPILKTLKSWSVFTVPLQPGEVYPQKDGQYPPPQQSYPPQQGVPPPQGGYPPQQAPPPYTQAQGGGVYNQQPGSYQQGTIVYTTGVVSDTVYSLSIMI